jgi:hypothetical protein
MCSEGTAVAHSTAPLALKDYRPRPQVVLPAHAPAAAAHPAIDAHTHLGRWLSDWVGRPREWMIPDVGAWVAAMEAYNVHAFVNLDGRWGPELRENLERFDHASPGRFATFAHVDWARLADDDGGVSSLVEQLRESAGMGAAGIKVWKDLGLQFRDADDVIVLPDDPRLRPIWETVAEVALPVWWHIADPKAFFDPVDERNENYELLVERPEWSFFGGGRPTFGRLMDSLEAVVSSYPDIPFVIVHAGCHAENLGWVSDLLDRYANVHIDIAARIAQLGRQPRATRDLILRHPDRILFGTDQIPHSGRDYGTYFRFLETEDEYFPHSAEDPQLMGRWMISGLGLTDDVLRALYSENVRRLLPALDDPNKFRL